MRIQVQRTLWTFIVVALLTSALLMVTVELLSMQRKAYNKSHAWTGDKVTPAPDSSQIRDPTIRSPFHYQVPCHFRVIVLTQRRPSDLVATVATLNRMKIAEDITACLDIWVDRMPDQTWYPGILDAAENAKFDLGTKTVHLRKVYAGSLVQWLSCWKASLESEELILIIEDDVSVSLLAYRWLNYVRNRYSMRDDVMGYSLTSGPIYQAKSDKSGKRKEILVDYKYPVFFNMLPGTAGFSPNAVSWRALQQWHSKVRNFKPYVSGIDMTTWYMEKEVTNEEDQVWYLWLIWYASSHKVYTIYNNIGNMITDNGRLSDDNSMLAVRRNPCPLDSASDTPIAAHPRSSNYTATPTRRAHSSDAKTGGSTAGALTTVSEVDRVRLTEANKKLLRSWRSEYIAWNRKSLKVLFNGTTLEFNTY